ncbi:MAG: SPASM domain-containing protein [Bryobacterales bacterium]|nr:SPASM domain-containing protein [Bryobacterales bacterium]
MYRDLEQPELPERRGRIILAGGEVLLEGVRQEVLYPALEQLHEKYRHQGGVEIVVQTTGDLVTEPVVRELLARHASAISVSGLDAYHQGLEEQTARDALQSRLTAIFDSLGMKPWTPPPRPARDRYYHFFGATPDQWIGKLWPRGRAWRNGLSTADLTENFCNRWSGGLNFLEQGFSGSEVSVDPDGNVYPCCLKTRKPVGNLLERPLEEILRSLAGNPVYEAISMGHPERMGIHHGWTVETFLEKSKAVLPSGAVYRNLCIGCDRFHEEVLLAPTLVRIDG